MTALFAAVEQPDLMAARQQMALSLGWHIIIACLGVGCPILILIAEWRYYKTDDPIYLKLARRWAKAFGVLFAVGAVSGTILSFEMGVLWPGLMGKYGGVIGLPFALEGFAFFAEAIFLGIYLYGWNRVSRRQHLFAGFMVALSGTASAWFIVTANAWMNQPQGFDLVDGKVVNIDPWSAMLNPGTPPQTTHMILASYMVTGFVVSSVYAIGMLKGRRDRYHRLGFLIPFVFAIVITPFQIGVGDWAARFLAEKQPTKLAAIEGQFKTEKGAPLHIGGVFDGKDVRYAIEIPKALSLLGKGNPNATIEGLERVSEADRPPVNIVRFSFQLMVAIGFGLLALGGWFAITWRRKKDMPQSKWFLRAAALSGVAAVVALEAGWIVTEVGRQPWIVYEVMRTEDAVSAASNLRVGYYVVAFVYVALTAATVYVLRRIARANREADAGGDGGNPAPQALPVEPQP